MEFLAPMLVMITAALTIGSIWRSHIVNRRLRENARVWADLQSKLIERFDDAAEVVRYLESDGGRRLLEGQSSAPNHPHSRVLDSVHLGLLATAGGIGMLLASGVSEPQVSEFMHVMGLIVAVVGVGFLASATVSWALLRGWGLLGRDEHPTEVDLRG